MKILFNLFERLPGEDFNSFINRRKNEIIKKKEKKQKIVNSILNTRRK